MLTKLPTGTWVELASVIAIRYVASLPEVKDFRRPTPARVVLEYGGEIHEVIEYTSDEEAMKARDDLAAQCNQQKRGGGK